MTSTDPWRLEHNSERNVAVAFQLWSLLQWWGPLCGRGWSYRGAALRACATPSEAFPMKRLHGYDLIHDGVATHG